VISGVIAISGTDRRTIATCASPTRTRRRRPGAEITADQLDVAPFGVVFTQRLERGLHGAGR
jgi:hypothetical protein